MLNQFNPIINLLGSKSYVLYCFLYEKWRGSSLTIANMFLPLENLQYFANRRRQAIAYKH